MVARTRESASSVYRNDDAVARLHVMYRHQGRRSLGGAKHDPKQRSCAQRTFDLDLATHALDQTLDDGQAKTVAVDVACFGALLAEELLKQLRQIFRSDADPGIRHFDQNLALAKGSAQTQGAIVATVFDGIAHQDGENGLEIVVAD